MFLNSRRNVLQVNQTGSVSRARCKLLLWKAHCEPRFGETSKRSIRAEIRNQISSKIDVILEWHEKIANLKSTAAPIL